MARRTPGPVVSPENPVIPAHELERRYVATAESLRGRSFDVIVVGAGACGCTFAARLCAEAPGTSVLLLEAGGEAQNSSAVRVPNAAMGLWRSEVDWGFRSEPQPGLLPRGRCMELEQGKTLGGSSAINYLVWVRGQRADFERWERTHSRYRQERQGSAKHGSGTIDRTTRSLIAPHLHLPNASPRFPE